MSISAHLIHQCDVERARQVTDEYGQDALRWPPDVPAHLSGVRCRLVTKAQRIADSVTGEFPIVTNYLLLLPAHTDVTPKDRITNVVDEAGVTDSSIYRIEAVLSRRARVVRHISLALEKVK